MKLEDRENSHNDWFKKTWTFKKKTHDKIQWTSNHSWTFAIENVCVSQALRVF